MESKKHDPFLDLSLDIPDKYYDETDSDGRPICNISDCLSSFTEVILLPLKQNRSEVIFWKIRYFFIVPFSSFGHFQVEELDETELYYCNACKCKQKSTKRFSIRRLPNVLCLHIKRFRWNNFFRTKIDIRVKFPLESLDLSQYVLNSGPDTRRRSTNSNNVYDLAATVVHHGNGWV